MNSLLSIRSGVMATLLFLTSAPMLRAEPDDETPPTPRGYLGIYVGDKEEGKKGIWLRDVTPDSPAAAAGLKKGDRIVKLDGKDIEDVETFLRSVAAKKPGDQLTIGIVRDDKTQNLTVKLGERPAREGPGIPEMPRMRRPAFLGVQTQPLSPEMKQRLNVDVDAGAVVTEVVPNSPADKAGLKRDDVITGVQDQSVKTPSDLRDAVQKMGAGKELTLQVLRGKEKLSLKATLRPGTFGFFLTPGEERFPSVDVESMFDQSRRIRELEHRVDELEKQLQELKKK